MTSTSTLPISAVIITLNEEQNIARTLAPLLNLCDEIIVVDSGSTDKTKEICEKLGVKFLGHVWEGYGTTKNWGNRQAKHDWILSIDADEVVSDELAQSIRMQFKSDPSSSGFFIARMTNYCGTWIRHGGWYPEFHIRLFLKDKFEWDLAEVHEKLVFAPELKIGKLKGDLLHYSYTSTQDHLDRIEKYATLGAEKMHRMGKKASFIKRYVSPSWKFLLDYFLKLGFLDGIAGYQIAKWSAYETWLKYDKLRNWRK